MSVITVESLDRRSLVESHRAQLFAILERYKAKNPRLFGSVACGDADADSDVDILVDLTDDSRNPLMRVAGIAEEFSQVLGVRVDVAAAPLLRDGVSRSALAQASRMPINSKNG